MKYDTIGILIRTPLTKRDYERFGVERLKGRGFRVLFLDFTQLLNPKYLFEHQPYDLLKYQDTFNFKTNREFIDFLKNKKSIFIIDLIGGSSKTLFIYRALKKFNIQYATSAFNSVVAMLFFPGKTNLGKIIEKLLKIILGKIKHKEIYEIFKNKFAYFVYSLPYYINRLQPPLFTIADGYKYARRLPNPSKRTKIVWAHALDYDLYLLKRDELINSGDFCVFLDEFFPFHPDFLIFGSSASEKIKPKDYYNSLNCFFDWFEKELEVPLIIAAHPRSRYDKKNNYFAQRNVERDKTIELVSKAKYVLAHSSTSINFAVIYKKPIIFLTSNQIEDTIYGPYIATLARQFNKKPINVDHAQEYSVKNLDFEVVEELYGKYFSNYIKVPGSPQRYFWDIVAGQIVALS